MPEEKERHIMPDEGENNQPEWLERTREQMSRDTANMTIQEEMNYYRSRAYQFRDEQNERLRVRR
jgi:hypothetical protein